MRYLSRPNSKEEKVEMPGCMGGMVHFFDLHQLLFTSSICTKPHQQTTSSAASSPLHHHNPSKSQGFEAPRNSLEELDKPSISAPIGDDDDYFDIPYGVQLAPAKKKELRLWVEEEKRITSQSVTPRTPNVVARLMGLDVLPDEEAFFTPTAGSQAASLQHSPKASTKKKIKKHPRQPLQRRDCNIPAGSRSLPETPRASSERYRDADPRLSLQINKENNESLSPNIASTRRKDCTMKVQDENKSPRSRYYAREIMKQVKDNISKRGGEKSSSAKPSSPSRSPPFCNALSSSPMPEIPKPQLSSRSYSDPKGNTIKSSKCQKARFERYTEKIKKHNPQPQKRTILDADKVSNLSHRKHPEISLPSPLLNGPRKSRVSSQKSSFQWSRKMAKEEDPEFHYVRSVLERAGITSTRTHTTWFSPSLPIDPFIFHRLELDLPFFLSGPIRHRCNRKLVFHLVEEILGELITCRSPHQRLHELNKELLLERIWAQIRSYPSLDCQVIGDIDKLVAEDLTEAKMKRLLQHPSVVAEAEDIASEIERNVLDSVIGDAVHSLYHSCVEVNRR